MNFNNNRQIRFFISSTFEDMQEERNYLMRRTFPELRELALKRNVVLTVLDLRWGITAEEERRNEVVEICFREIENSIPFFIGIIGNRYGWIPEKEPNPESKYYKEISQYIKKRLSVTDMEMRFGVLEREEEINAFFFIKEQQKASADKSLESLKKAVNESGYPTYTYSSIENLAEQVKKNFTALLNKLFPQNEQPTTPIELEHNGQRTNLFQLQQFYISDGTSFSIINDWAQNWNEDNKYLVSTGASGIGKSALLANWITKKLQEPSREFEIVYHFVANSNRTNYQYILRSLIYEICSCYPSELDYKEIEEKLKEQKEENVFSDILQQITEKKRLVIVLDAINQTNKNAKSLLWISKIPKNIKILFSSLEKDETMEVFKSHKYPIHKLNPLTDKQRADFIEEYLKLYGKKLSKEQKTRIADDSLCKNTLILKTLLNQLIYFGKFETLDNIIGTYVKKNSEDDFYNCFLNSYAEEYGKDIVRSILSLIALSRDGLTEDELLNIINTDKGKIVLKPILWAQFYRSFSSHLTNKNGYLYFAHDYIRKAIETTYLKDKQQWRQDCRKKIIAGFLQQNNPRAWSELTYQYYNLKDATHLLELVLNVDVFYHLYSYSPRFFANCWIFLQYNGFSLKNYIPIIEKFSDDKQKFTLCTYLTAFCQDNLINKGLALEFANKALLYAKTEKDKANSYCLMSGAYKLNGQPEMQLKSLLNALALRKNSNDDVSLLASTYNQVGTAYGELKQYTDSLKYLKTALNIRLKHLSEKHSDIAASYCNIGIIYKSTSNLEEAKKYFSKALQIANTNMGKNKHFSARIYHNLGELYDKYETTECYQKALQYKLQELKIRKRFLYNTHPDLASTYNGLGVTYTYLKQHDTALKYKNEALKINKMHLGEKHIQTARSYINLGISYFELKQYDKALYCYQKALPAAESSPLYVKDLIDYLKNIAIVYYDIKDYENALLTFQKVIKIYELLKVPSEQRQEVEQAIITIQNKIAGK